MTDQSAKISRANRAHCSTRYPGVLLCALLFAVAHPAQAAGTIAGTDIQNIASATYDTPSGSVTIQSNTIIIKVDELLNVTVASTDPGNINTAPGLVGNVQAYRVTNTGNGNEAFALTANTNNGGDDFDPTFQKIVIDTNDNGVFDPGIDVDYIPGTNEPVIGPDLSKVFFIITNTPAGVVDLSRANVGLTAVAVTGSGTPGTTFAGAGQGGGNAVVGVTGATSAASGFLLVQATSVALVKSATILDPFGGSRPVPGAVITYTIAANVTGSGTLANFVITDPIPVGVTYEASSITFQNAALTDAADADAGNYNGTVVSVAAGSIPAGETRTLTFKVRIP